ncbi:2,5-didehydrogluconate reductase DkgA [Edwardsiella anguillarum]|uniref:Methylglyoxal reductase, acetol producing / 2,5-diketo-D-gluconate reductase A n=1 Tax=Edwardsiella anguillarum ET080813 TaxID=667120 RepID=A0A076LM86_9GAMM|nr:MULTISPECIES: 2,5-didehydrogluconate reductase DkgA [Edwardsiella]AKM46713.1 2,5-diketo-D-gluconic acid reductase [Edwardsiella sp. EA181011]GAJ68450.1 aldo/keto reductase [Edwardsiella piscicida]AIJ07867.1 Methylglyoxal reductase, acetol producing / 2,5-diketo-D-gluconate reductase A [Edwardsiella anguillarum ET080813]AKR78965.1 2,5-didehydrogluconate reductase DkgA [Edwardsiella sp. LADL05-105]KAB0588166.1 2,5-didehydrogluconate reductase DkgA [Edwardsiella anguillarum]
MSTPPFITLNDGNRIPQLGLGVWQVSDTLARDVVSEALRVGYRAIDTAAIYGNESGVGQALQHSGLARESLFITTKLWNADHMAVDQAFHASLHKLRLEYVDLYLIHWPMALQDTFVHAWRRLIDLRRQGVVKSIGVCNFNIDHLQRLLDETGVVPTINQIELHPLMQQRELQSWNHHHGIATEAWSPLAQGGEGVFDAEPIRRLAAKYGKTPAQIVIRWHLDCGRIVIPKTVSAIRLRENINVFDFTLEASERAQIARLECGKRLGSDPATYMRL